MTGDNMFNIKNRLMSIGLARTVLAGFLTLCIFPGIAQAKYPSSPINLVVGFPPGGSNDIVARILAPKLSEILGVGVVVDNRPGANATIGTDYTVRAKPNGYTITLGSASPIAVSPTTIANLPYNPETDLTAITTVAMSPALIAVNPKVPAKTLKELVALAKTKDITMASSGVGGLAHLSIEALRLNSGGHFVHVPYKGAGPAINDVIGDQVDGIIMDLPALAPFVANGQLRALALASDHQPANAKPGAPILAKTVVPDLVSLNWFIVMAPAKTPPAIVQTLHDALVSTVNDPKVKAQLLRLGYEPMTQVSPAASQAFVKSETLRWRRVATAAGIQAK
jgi:tripartite-type tricarboxylate transporter receptor subunit TctC